MLSTNNVKNKKFRENAPDAVNLALENTVSHINIPKFKRWYAPLSNERLIRDHFGDNMVPDWLFGGGIKACDTYYDQKKNNYVWRPIVFAPDLPGLKIYYTLVNRMDYIQELLDRRGDAKEDVVMALLEVQDSYQLLSLHMEMKNTYGDSQLEEGQNKWTKISPVTVYDPESNGAPMSISEIPCVMSHLPYIAFWSENDGYATDNLLVQRILFLLYKCLPYPYKRRSIENAIVESWSDIMQRVFLKNADKNEQEKERMRYERDFTSDLYQVTIRIMLGSLFGVYEHCQTRANFRTRRKLYKWFCLNRPAQEEMSHWILKYKELVLCSFREYMFYMTSHVGGISDYLSRMSYWNILKYTTYESMDNVRAQINNSIDRYHEDYTISDRGLDNLWNDTDTMCCRMSNKYYTDQVFSTEADNFEWYPGLSWFYKVQRDLDASNRSMLKNTNRPKTDTFEKMVLIKMNEIESKMKKGSINLHSVDPDFLSPEIVEYIKNKIRSADQFEKIPYQSLGDVPVRFNAKYLHVLQNAEELYEYEEGSVELKDTLCLFYSKMPYEYQVLKLFFTELIKKQGLVLYYATKDIFEKQIKGLNEIYETVPGTKLDDSAGLYYLCPNCNNIKIVVRDVSSVNNPNSLGGWSSDGVCICLDTEKFYCSYLNSKDTPKKRDPTKAIIKNMFTGKDRGLDSQILNVKRLMDLEDVKSLRKYVGPKEKVILDKYIEKRQRQEDCLNTELIPVYLPGHLIKVQNKLVMACPQCLHPVYYSREMFRNGIANMSCGCKDRKSEVEFKCFVCHRDCHDYCFVKAIWDDTMNPLDITDENLPFKYVCLCSDHKSRWTNEMDMVPKASQLDRSNKHVKVKFKADGKFVVNNNNNKSDEKKQEGEEEPPKEKEKPKVPPLMAPRKRKKTAAEAHSEFLAKKQKLPAPETKKKAKSDKTKNSLEKKMRNLKGKNRDSVKKSFNVAKAPSY